MKQTLLDSTALLSTLRYWRECGIDRLSGEQFGFSALKALPVVAQVSRSAQPPIVKEVAVSPVVSLDRLLTPPVCLEEKIPLLASLAHEVSVCQQCRLSLTRHQTVFGRGSDSSVVVFVGDVPKEEEERGAEPFAGEAREILNGMLLAIGFQREQVYLTNIIKCRPPGDRPPKSDEIMQCQGYLGRQLELIRPKVIFAMGKVAIGGLLGRAGDVGSARGRVHSWRGIPVIASYHPAFCLRTPNSKRAVWEDLLLLLATLEQDVNTPSKQEINTF